MVRYLSLCCNQLSGTIPVNISALTRLSYVMIVGVSICGRPVGRSVVLHGVLEVLVICVT